MMVGQQQLLIVPPSMWYAIPSSIHVRSHTTCFRDLYDPEISSKSHPSIFWSVPPVDMPEVATQTSMRTSEGCNARACVQDDLTTLDDVLSPSE